MLHWPEFKATAPEIAAIGEGLLNKPERAEVAILATVDSAGRPWVAPFCPIFTEHGVYLLAGAQTPKVRHLNCRQVYALHALLGPDDLEFQISGAVRAVRMNDERAEVIAAIPFPSFNASDPIFELLIDRALTVTWPEPGRKNKQAWSFD